MKKIVLIILIILLHTKIHAQTCNIINISPVNFGNYDVSNNIPNDATGSITIDCTKRAIVRIMLDRGLYSQTFSVRYMKHSFYNDLLAYNLYTSSSRTTIWGDGTGGSSTLTIEVKQNRPATAIIYGRVFPNQNVSIGSYNDIITITVLP